MSIKLKLVISNIAIVLLSIIVVSIPTMMISYGQLVSDLNRNALDRLAIARLSVMETVNRPAVIVGDVVSYVELHDDWSQIESYMARMTEGKREVSQLYYCNTIPVRDGGFFRSSTHWVPPADYDQRTRPWFKAGQEARSTYGMTEPYMALATKTPVASLSQRVMTGGSFSGIVSIDISLTGLTDTVGVLTVSDNGESFLLDRNGMYITNHDSSKIFNGNFFEDYKFGAALASEIRNGGTYAQMNNGKGRYLYATTISDETGWIFVTTGRSKEIFSSITSSVRVVVCIAVAALGVAFVLAFLISSKIVTPLITINHAVSGIAEGNADLTVELQASSHDEVGGLVGGFNKFVRKLRTIVSDIKASKNVLIKAGSALDVSTQDTASSITQILANIESVHGQVSNQSASVNQAAGAVNQISANIESLEHMIDNQSASVAQASSAVEEMIGNIKSVNGSVDKMADAFETLQARASKGVETRKALVEKVGEIETQSKMLKEANTAIASIASQTNLLAMNAAIEAAHAGEAGKGFAVVADEIRKLSETSSAQSRTIGQQLKGIQATISTMVVVSQNVGDAFGSVADGIEETDVLVRQIKSAMAEQNEGSKQISTALHTMNDSTLEVSNASREMAEGNKAILAEMRNLQDTSGMIDNSMGEMTVGAQKINETGVTLREIAVKMRESIEDIGNQIDQFRV